MSTILGDAYVRIRPDGTGFEGASAGIVKKSLGKTFDIVKKASLAVGGVLGAAGAIGVKTAADLETAKIAFTTMLGSAEKANKFLKDLQDFAAKTPFDFPGLQTAASSLVSVGINADDVIPIMTSLGNATSGMGTGAEGVQRATTALQQMSAAGKIGGQDLKQLRDAGIPVYDVLSAALGKTTAEVSELAGAGKLGKKELDLLMNSLKTGKGLERFSGLMDKQSASLTGLFSTLKDTIQMDLASAVTPFVPALKKMLDAAAPLLDKGLTLFSDQAMVLQKQIPNLFDLFRNPGDDPIEGFAEIMDNIFGNTGDKIDFFTHMAEQFMPVLKSLKGIFVDLFKISKELGPVLSLALGGSTKILWEAFKLLLPVVEKVLNFFANNKAALYTFAIAIGAITIAMKAHQASLAVTAAGGMVKYLKSINLVKKATKIWTAIQWAFNKAIKANPIGIVITVIALLVGGLILAYKKSETFHRIVTNALHAVGEAGTWLWEKALKPAFNAIKAAWGYVARFFVAAYESKIKPNLEALAMVWHAVATAASWAWSKVISPVLKALGIAAGWLWNSILKPVLGAIVWAWGKVADGFGWGWANVISPVLKALGIAAGWLWGSILKPVFGAIGWAWDKLASAIGWAWDNIIYPVLKVFGKVVSWLWDQNLKTVFSMIGSAWGGMITGMKWAWDSVLHPVFNALVFAAKWVYENVIKKYFQVIALEFKIAFAVMKWAWESILKPVFGALADSAKWLYNSVLSGIFTAISASWTAILKAMDWAWTNILKPVWDGIGIAATWLVNKVLAPVFRSIQKDWEFLVTSMQWAWDHILKPTWDAITAAANWLWAKVLVPVFSAIKRDWEFLVTSMQWAWDHILKPTWDAIIAAAKWLWETVLRGIFISINATWNATLTAMQWAWDHILKPVWKAVTDSANWLWDRVLKPAFANIQTGWDRMGRGFQKIYNTIIKPVWGWFTGAVNTMKDSFSTAVDFIGRVWEGMKSKLLAPVKWVVDVVYNNGLRKLWNTISKLWSGDPLPEFKMASSNTTNGPAPSSRGMRQAMADGGVLNGYTPGRDVHQFYSPTGGRLDLSGGEAILRPELTKALGKDWVHSANAAARKGGESGAAGFLGKGQHFAKGGVYGREMDARSKTLKNGLVVNPTPFGAFSQFEDGSYKKVSGISNVGWFSRMFQIVKAHFPYANLNSGYRPGDLGGHGRGNAVDLGDSRQAGGRGNPYLVAMNRWIYDTFGRTAKTLIYSGAGDDRPNLFNGKPHEFGAATNMEHRNHVHWEAASLPGGGGDEGAKGGKGFVGTVLSGIGSFLGGLSPVKWLTGKVEALYGGLTSKFGKNPITEAMTGIPKLALKKLTELIPGMGGGDDPAVTGSYTNGGNVGTWINEARKYTSISPTEEAHLRTLIQRESGGNPRAINLWDSNAKAGHPSKGLVQTIDSTFQGNRDHRLPNDIYNPVSSILAGVNYMRRTYPGGILGVQQGDASRPAKGYKLGGIMPKVFDTGGMLMHGEAALNRSGKPERILDPNQTKQFDRMVSSNEGHGALVGSLTIQVGDGATVKDGLEETLFQLRRIQRGGGPR